MYKSKKYWNERVEPNPYNNIFEPELTVVPSYVKGHKTLLDFGCGIGRLFELYKGMEVTGIDFSKLYEQRAKKHAFDLRLKYNHSIFDIHELGRLPFNNNEFECGVLSRVLLHAPNDEMELIVSEMARVCETVLVVNYEHNGQKLAPHVFGHDFEKTLDKLNLETISIESKEDQQIVIKYKAK